MSATSELVDRWEADLAVIAERLIAVFDLRHRREVETLSSPLFRWLDFRLRFVEPRPRQVFLSDRIVNDLTPEARDGFRQFLARVAAGHDLNPYQGRGLTLRHDTSNQKREQRTDLLFADWGILHFHLTTEPVPEGRYFSKPSDWLAYCLVMPGEMGVVAVGRHPDVAGFADPSILHAALRSFPAFADAHRVKGALGLRHGGPRSQEDIHTLRTGGVTSFIEYEGAVYFPPGGGISTASTSTKVQIRQNWIHTQLRGLAAATIDSTGPFLSHPRVAPVMAPDFVLRLCPDGVGLLERHSKTLFAIPAHTPGADRSLMVQLSATVAPAWAVERARQQPDVFDEWFIDPGLPQS